MREKGLDLRDTLEFDTSDVHDTIEISRDEQWADLDPMAFDVSNAECDPGDTFRIRPARTEEFDPDATIKTPPPEMVEEEEVVSGEIVCHHPAPVRHHANISGTGMFERSSAADWPGCDQLDRREQQRHHILRPVRFRLPPHPIFSAAKIFDLSQTGMFIETERHILPGNYVCGSFEVDGEPITFKGEVVWKTNPERYPCTGRDGFGVRFCYMQDDELQQIDRLLQNIG